MLVNFKTGPIWDTNPGLLVDLCTIWTSSTRSASHNLTLVSLWNLCLKWHETNLMRAALSDTKSTKHKTLVRWDQAGKEAPRRHRDTLSDFKNTAQYHKNPAYSISQCFTHVLQHGSWEEQFGIWWWYLRNSGYMFKFCIGPIII